MKTVQTEAEFLLKKMTAWRRTIHQYPELSFRERKTAALIAAELARMPGVRVSENVAGTGVVAVAGSGKGPTIALRADMDALPIQEQTGLAFTSVHNGVMHACGHDAHCAMMLGAATLLSARFARNSEDGTVKFVFQPAEETTDESGESGAKKMLDAGVYDDVDAALALHVCPWLSVGEIQVNDGYSMANVDVFSVEIQAAGGHGGYPHLSPDPIWMLAQALQAFYAIPSRKMSPLDPVAASIGEIQSGTQDNVIPGRVVVRGTLRSYAPEMRRKLAEETEKAFRLIESLGGQISFHLQQGEPALKNDAAINRLIKETAQAQDPPVRVVEGPFGMGGEDFGYVTETLPSAMFFLGCAPEDGERRELHTSRFDIDERCLLFGARLLADAAWHWINERSGC